MQKEGVPKPNAMWSDERRADKISNIKQMSINKYKIYKNIRHSARIYFSAIKWQ
jgi:hypothetical protein